MYIIKSCKVKHLHKQILFLCTMHHIHTASTYKQIHTQHIVVRQEPLILACEKLSSVPSVSMKLLLPLLCSN